MKNPWLIGGAVVAGSGLAWLLFRERNGVEGVVERATQAQVQAAVKAIQEGKKVGRKLAQVITDLKPPKLALINQHNIAGLVNAYKGDVPFAVAMAIIEHESQFRPYRYNYYVKDYSKNPKGEMVKGANGKYILKQTDATPGAPLVEEWLPENRGDKMKNGGFEFDPHAVGLTQIRDDLRINWSKDKDGVKRSHKPYGYNGFPLPYLNDLIDPEKNIRASMRSLSATAKKIREAVSPVPLNDEILGMLVYMAHAEGPFKVIDGKGAKHQGVLSALKQAAKEVTWDNVLSLPWGSAGWWSWSNPKAPTGIRGVGERVEIWEGAKKNLLAQARPVEARG